MRHRTRTVKLGRIKGPRNALFKNLATSLILYEKVTTTEAKAKAIRPFVERLVTKGRVKNLHTKRELDRILPDKKAVKKILAVLGPKYKDRPGGYTRIVKYSPRKGDGAARAIIEFV